jgi:uncharacterized iron-regulated membrane protein
VDFRRVVFWTHLSVGVAAGLVILILSATGVLLTYERQIVAWSQNRAVVQRFDAAPLSADALAVAALAAGAVPGNAVKLARDPSAAVVVTAGRGAAFLLDPYSGQRMDGAGAGAAAFFAYVRAFHRWLALSGDARETGAAITGAANFAFLFMLVSGAYLWLPKLWRWRLVRMQLFFRRGLPNAKARHYNWHHVLGAWAVVPLLAIVLSGVVISYPWRATACSASTARRPRRAAAVPPRRQPVTRRAAVPPEARPPPSPRWRGRPPRSPTGAPFRSPCPNRARTRCGWRWTAATARSRRWSPPSSSPPPAICSKRAAQRR